MEIKTVGDIPETFTLCQNEDDVTAAAELLGCESDNYSYIFVEVGEGEYLQAYGCYRLGLGATVYPIPVP